MFCDNCGNEILDNESQFCDNCGNRLNFDEEPISNQTPESMPEYFDNPNISPPMQAAFNQEYSANKYDENYIAYANAQKAAPKSNKKAFKIAMIIACPLLVIIIFLLFFMIGKNDAEDAVISTAQETTVEAETETQETTVEETTVSTTAQETTTQEITTTTTTTQVTTTQAQETTLSSSQIQENNRALYIEYIENHASVDLLLSYQFADVNYDGVEEMIVLFDGEYFPATSSEFCTIVNSKVVLIQDEYCATSGNVFGFCEENETGKIVLVIQEYRNSGGVYGQFWRIQSFDGTSITQVKYSGYFQTGEYLEDYDGFYEKSENEYYYYFLSEDGGITYYENYLEGNLYLQYTEYKEGIVYAD